MPAPDPVIFVKQVGQLANDGAAKLFHIGDCNGPPIVPGDIMANTNRQKLYRGSRLNIADYLS
jgi:hypothetical protein